MTKHGWILLVVIVLMVSCEGPVGPQGPAGPAGPTGATGPPGQDFQYFTGTAAVNSEGGAAVALPVGAGDSTHPPLVNCWVGDNSGVWIKVGWDVSEFGATAGIVWVTNHWVAVLIGGVPEGWIFYVVAAW